MSKFNLYQRKLFDFLFKITCYASSLFSLLFMILFLTVVITKSYNALFVTKIKLEVPKLERNLPKEHMITKIKNIIDKQLSEAADEKLSITDINEIVSIRAPYQIYDYLSDLSSVNGEVEVWVNASTSVHQYFNKHRPLSLAADKAIKNLISHNRVGNFFNWQFFTNPDSSEAEIAGIGGSLVGSLMMVGICMLVAFPLGLITAIYLEEFAPDNFFTRLIEVNINNLSAVPSIVFGLLGLTLFVVIGKLPRSSALVGGLTLAILVLPIIVTTTRQALRTVPASIKDAALALGASKLQIIFHHTLAVALPTIVTGAILSISRALGETAPLIIIGMAAFITNAPSSIFDPATALPVQIYLWSDNPDVMFAERASLAILVLLIILSIVNFLAQIIRKKYYIKL